jgi:ABC-type branched-subunit amino acid transport system ATPase component
MASLIYDAEKSLKEILGIKNVIILVIDHDLDMFIKLNHELIEL